MKRIVFSLLIVLAVIAALTFQHWFRPAGIEDDDTTRRVEQVDRRTSVHRTATEETTVRIDRKVEPTQPGDEGRRARRDADERRRDEE